MSRKALFLDVDGVLNHEAQGDQWRITGSLTLDPACCDRVKRIVEATGCEIVLSSTWRLLARHCLVLGSALAPLRITEVTRQAESGQRREADIAEWLSRHPEVTEFAILDDDSDCGHDAHFVKTDHNEGGLTDALADRVIAVLGLGPSGGRQP